MKKKILTNFDNYMSFMVLAHLIISIVFVWQNRMDFAIYAQLIAIVFLFIKTLKQLELITNLSGNLLYKLVLEKEKVNKKGKKNGKKS